LGEEKAKSIMGDKGTFSRRLRELANALNTDDDGNLLNVNEWEIVYPGYQKTENSNQKNGKIYYSHPIDYYEMSFLIQQVRSTHSFTSKEKESLEKRLIAALCSEYYDVDCHERNAIIYEEEKVDLHEDGSHFSQDDWQLMESKLKIIREHIINKKMLEIRVEYYNNNLTIRVSPYRIIHKDGCYWMIGNWHERPNYDKKWNSYTDALTAFCIDRISNLSTACTPDSVFIHWTMTKYLLPDQSYTRESMANRETRARYNDSINNKLEELDRIQYSCEMKHFLDL